MRPPSVESLEKKGEEQGLLKRGEQGPRKVLYTTGTAHYCTVLYCTIL